MNEEILVSLCHWFDKFYQLLELIYKCHIFFPDSFCDNVQSCRSRIPLSLKKKWNETYTYMNHSGQEWHKNPTKMMQTFLRSRWKKEKTLGRIDHMTTDSPFWFHAIGETKWTVGQNFEPAGNKNLVSTLVCLVLPKMPTASYKVSKNRRELCDVKENQSCPQ